MPSPLRPLIAALALLIWSTSIAQTPPTIDEEIARLRRELATTQADCRRAADETKKDAKDFEAYRARTAERLTRARTQADTLRGEIARQQRINDDLAAQIAAVQTRSHDIELSQDGFRQQLVDVCVKLEPAVKALPPVTMPAIHSALTLLSSELSGRTIDIVEGCTRLAQLLNRIEETTSTIQIAQENSPVAEIRGMVYRLRIGSLFEAVVDTRGEQCAFFEGWNSDGTPRWKVVPDAPTAQALLQTVNIREGRSLPAFVSIPLNARMQGGVGGDR